jgi:hypothetical protein
MISVEQEVQESNPHAVNQIEPPRKIGMEVVRSANLTSRFFRGPRPKHSFRVWDENEAWARRVARAMR